MSIEDLPREVIQKFGTGAPRTVKESGEIDLSEEALERLSRLPKKAPQNPRMQPINWEGLVQTESGSFVEKEVLDGRNTAGSSS